MIEPIKYIFKRQRAIFGFWCDDGNYDRHQKGQSHLKENILRHLPRRWNQKALHKTQGPLHIAGHYHIKDS